MTTEAFRIVIPNHSRLFRRLARELPSVDIEVPSVPSAPIAVEADLVSMDGTEHAVAMLGWNGALWRPFDSRWNGREDDGTTAERLRWLLDSKETDGNVFVNMTMIGIETLGVDRTDTKEAKEKIERAGREDFAVIGGVMHRKSGPPRWEVETAGYDDPRAFLRISVGEIRKPWKVQSCHHARLDVARELLANFVGRTRLTRLDPVENGRVRVIDPAYDPPQRDFADVATECWRRVVQEQDFLIDLEKPGIMAWAEMKDAAPGAAESDREALLRFAGAFDEFTAAMKAHKGPRGPAMRGWIGDRARWYSDRFEIERAHLPAPAPAP